MFGKEPTLGGGNDMVPVSELAPLLVREGRRRMLPLVLIFAAIALLALLFGLFVLEKNYESSTTILAQQSDIIQPLLEGRAVATGTIDHAGIARQTIFSRKVLNESLQIGGWIADDPRPVEHDRLMATISWRS